MKLLRRDYLRKSIIPLVLSSLILIAAQSKAQEQNPAETFNNVTKITIHSKVLNEDRNLFVALPKDYSAQKGLPVLYMLDGEMIYPYGEALESTEDPNIGSHIIVGIQTNINRNRDMIPVAIESRPGSGGAGKFLEFVITELKPFIDSSYNTSGFNILYGASNAGLFTTYAMLGHPEIFDAYISSSTMIGHCPDYMYKKLEKIEVKSDFNGKILYVHWGMKDYFKQVTEFLPKYYDTLNERLKDQLVFGIKAIENGDHVPPGGIKDGLTFIYSNL